MVFHDHIWVGLIQAFLRISILCKMASINFWWLEDWVLSWHFEIACRSLVKLACTAQRWAHLVSFTNRIKFVRWLTKLPLAVSRCLMQRNLIIDSIAVKNDSIALCYLRLMISVESLVLVTELTQIKSFNGVAWVICTSSCCQVIERRDKVCWFKRSIWVLMKRLNNLDIIQTHISISATHPVHL